MARPRIVLIGGDGGRSGVPRYLAQLTRALAPVADVTVMSDVDRGGYGFAASEGVPHLVLPGLASSLRAGRVIGAGHALDRALTRLAPDAVWAHARLSLPLARIRAARRAGGPRLIVTYHGLPFGKGHGPFASGLSRLAEIAALAASPVHDLVFLTEEDRAAFAVPGRARHRTHVLTNASDLGGFEPAPARSGPRRLLMLTRDAAQKDLDAAARLFADLPADCELHLHGMGTDAPALAARFAAILPAGALARVRFHGETPDVRPALAAADLYLCTSRYEGLSIAMIEAMEYGLPVVTTPVGGTALLARLHPMFERADLRDASGRREAAAAIDRLTRAFRAAPAEAGARIHAAWQSAFAPDVWAVAARALLADILGRPR